MKQSAYTSCPLSPINFNWGSGGPDTTNGCNVNSSTTNSATGFTADNFTSYGEGYIKLPNLPSGSVITFNDSSDDGFMLYLGTDGNFDSAPTASGDSRAYLTNWVDQGANTYDGSGTITLSSTCSTTTFCANGVYPIQVYHHENGGGASVQLFWSYTGQAATIVPSANLSTASSDLPTAQTITFNSPGTQTYSSSGTVSLTATASSGLTVSYASTTTSVCTVSGSTVSIVSAGSCSITASQSGNTAYSAAPSVTQAFTISPATLSLPSSITASAVSNNTTSATVSFTAATNATSTTVRVWTAATGGTQVGTDWTNFASGGTITGLSAATTYYIGLTSIGTGNYSNSAESTRVSVTTNTAANAPTISVQPTNLFKTSPQSASLTVSATGNGTLSYQWQVKVGGSGSFANVTYGSGSTSATYTLDTSHCTNGDQYQVIVTNTLNGTTATTTSSTATLTLAGALSITTPSTGLTAIAGSPFSLSFTGSSLVSGGRTPYAFSVSGTLPSGITLSNTTSGVISGTATAVGTYSVTTTVTDSNTATATTNSYAISVIAGATTTLVKTQVISSSTASGAIISIQPKFTLQDAYGNLASSDSTAVVAAIYSGSGGALRGTTSVTPSSGVATFSNLVLDGVNGNQYVLSFTHAGATTVYETITATTGSASQLILTTSNNFSSAANARLSLLPILTIADSGGNIVNSTASVTMALSSGAGGNLMGLTTVNAVAGTATYSNVIVGGISGTAYVFSFSSSGLTSAYETITVLAGPALTLGIATQPAGFPSGLAAIAQPVISLQDYYGNVANNNVDTVTATISSGATLVGTTSVVTSTGSAVFTNLGVSGTPGSVYTLTFTSAVNSVSTTYQVVVEDAVDSSMQFDGSTTYAVTPALTMSKFSDTTFTSEAWANPATGACSSQQVIWERNTVGGSTASNYSWALFCLNKLWYATYYNTANSTWVNLLLGPVENGQWQHLAFTFSTSNWDFSGYFNGTKTIEQTIANTTTFNSGDSPVEVGGNGGLQEFNGSIDELKFWNVVRTATQINSDMNSWGPVAANNGLSLYYDFNDYSPSVIFNRAWNPGSSSDLTLHGNYTTADLKSSVTCTLANHSCVSFSRTYLNPFGGWQVPTLATTASVLVVAGGGGGTAQTDNSGWVGGGGGAGGYQLFNSTPLTPGSYVPVIVGAGGYAGQTYSTGWGLGLNGTNSQFASLAQSVGGGAGGGMSTANTGTVNGANGGSGGGGGTYYSTSGGGGGSKTPGQGNDGGHALAACCGSGGGGGAGGAGAYSTSATTPALGGVGLTNPFYGVSYLAAGGNGAGGSTTSYYVNNTSTNGSTPTGASASPNTGSGGGGGGGGTSSIWAGSGGTGLVFVEYVNALPIVSNPSNVTSTAGIVATLLDTNTAVSGLTRTYIWQVSSNNGNTWSTAPNGTGTNGSVSGTSGAGQVLANGSYVTPTLTTPMSGYQYRAVVVDTDIYGVSETTTTTAATLTVNPAMTVLVTPGTGVYGIPNIASAGFIQVSYGTGTAPYTFTVPQPSSLFHIDTSTASNAYVYLYSTGLPVGTILESVTVTDAAGATLTTNLPTTVSQASTTTSFTAGAAYYNAPDTLTATVTSVSQIAVAGTVTFKDASNNILCTTGSVSVTGTASCAWTPQTTNLYSITAYFSDNAGNFASSQSGASSVTPGKASITMSLAATSAVVAGATGSSALSITATLSPTGLATPLGAVAFTVNGSTACSGVSITSLAATCSYVATGAGVQNISAVYSGDATFNGANASTTTSVSYCSESVTVDTYGVSVPASGYCTVQFTNGTNGSWAIPTGVSNSQLLVVGGGASGGGRGGGGGGAGGLYYSSNYSFLGLSSVTVTIGSGGLGLSNSNVNGNNGSASVFGAITETGGTGGAAGTSPYGVSGAGSYNGTPYSSRSSGSGYYDGGSNVSGGGGAGAAGNGYNAATSSPWVAGSGGAGYAINISGTTACYAAGGGGGYGSNSGTAGSGGSCTGATTTAGAGSNLNATTAGSAAPNSGSGGGGASFYGGPGNGYSGAGGSGVVAVKYISPSIVTTNWDLTGDTMTVLSNTPLALVETATVFSFVRTITWQYSGNGGVSWNTETATATLGSNSSSAYTFVIRCGLHSSGCASNSVTYLYRARIADTDGTLITYSYSPIITVNVTALTPVVTPVLTYTQGIVGTSLTLSATSGSGLGAISFTNLGGGTASGCTLTGNSLSATSVGTCRIAAVQVADLDYAIDTGTATLVVFVTYIFNVQNQTPTPNSPIIAINGAPPVITTVTGTAPTITFVPATGSINGTLMITGTGFTGATSVRLGRTPIAFTVVSSTSISATIPGTAGSGNVVVFTPSGTAVWSAGFSWS